MAVITAQASSEQQVERADGAALPAFADLNGMSPRTCGANTSPRARRC